MIKIIAACSKNGIIGIKDDNYRLPFYYPEDLKHFKKLTLNSSIIMGKNTFESLGNKPLKNRTNIIITKSKINNIITFSSLKECLDIYSDSWLIGGSGIYYEGLNYCSEIHLTITPDYIEHNNVIKFPWINPLIFDIAQKSKINDSNLDYIIFKKII